MSLNNRLVEFIRDNQNELLEQWIEKLKKLNEGTYFVSNEVYQKMSYGYFAILVRHFTNSDKDQLDEIKGLVNEIVQLGWSLKLLLQSLKELKYIIFEKLTSNISDDKKNLEVILEFDQCFLTLNHEILYQYSSSWERTVSLQKIALQELSAPLIPVTDDIMVMPLVGTIDTERAKTIIENLLHGVVQHQAQVVLIDITGVPVVDTMVAHHIIQAAEAVRLVGSQCLLVGIRPEIAQTIVNIGIDLNHIITKNTLQKGIEAALKITNQKIIHVEV